MISVLYYLLSSSLKYFYLFYKFNTLWLLPSAEIKLIYEFRKCQNSFSKRFNSYLFDIIDPHLNLGVEAGGDSRFTVFLGSKSKFTLGFCKISMEKSIF